MYMTLLLTAISITGYLARNSMLALWSFGSAVASCLIWTAIRYKSVSDYADLSAQRFRILILVSEMKERGFNQVTDRYLGGITSNWIILRAYIRRVNMYRIARKNLFLRQWIAQVPLELESVLFDLDDIIMAALATRESLMLEGAARTIEEE